LGLVGGRTEQKRRRTAGRKNEEKRELGHREEVVEGVKGGTRGGKNGGEGVRGEGNGIRSIMGDDV